MRKNKKKRHESNSTKGNNNNQMNIESEIENVNAFRLLTLTNGNQGSINIQKKNMIIQCFIIKCYLPESNIIENFQKSFSQVFSLKIEKYIFKVILFLIEKTCRPEHCYSVEPFINATMKIVFFIFFHFARLGNPHEA